MQKSSKMPRQVKAHAGVEPAYPCVLRRLYPTIDFVVSVRNRGYDIYVSLAGGWCLLCGLRGERE